MIDKKELPFIVSLINDESESVRTNILNGLLEFGPKLYEYLTENNCGLNDHGMRYLFKLLTEYVSKKPENNTLSKYKIGEVITHQRYHYDGVIADIDFYCLADENWYKNNNTQPLKMQPWYHILVDNSSTVTYAAESSLFSPEYFTEIKHPFIQYFFTGSDNNQYIRNQEPWPREDKP